MEREITYSEFARYHREKLKERKTRVVRLLRMYGHLRSSSKLSQNLEAALEEGHVSVDDLIELCIRIENTRGRNGYPADNDILDAALYQFRDFKNMNLSGRQLTGIPFMNMDLSGSTLDGAEVWETCFDGSLLHEADIPEIILEGESVDLDSDALTLSGDSAWRLEEQVTDTRIDFGDAPEEISRLLLQFPERHRRGVYTIFEGNEPAAIINPRAFPFLLPLRTVFDSQRRAVLRKGLLCSVNPELLLFLHEKSQQYPDFASRRVNLEKIPVSVPGDERDSLLIRSHTRFLKRPELFKAMSQRLRQLQIGKEPTIDILAR